MPVGPSYQDGSLIFVSISAFEVFTHKCNLRFQFPLFKTLVSLQHFERRSRHNACSIPEVGRTVSF